MDTSSELRRFQILTACGMYAAPVATPTTDTSHASTESKEDMIGDNDTSAAALRIRCGLDRLMAREGAPDKICPWLCQGYEGQVHGGREGAPINPRRPPSRPQLLSPAVPPGEA